MPYSIDDPLALFDKIYDKPWTRFGPYLIGMIVGWILFKTDCKISMKKVKIKYLVEDIPKMCFRNKKRSKSNSIKFCVYKYIVIFSSYKINSSLVRWLST